MSARLKTAVLGATGYSGLELTRILLRHPRLEKPALLRRSGDNGSASDLADVFPALSGNGGYPLHSLSWPALMQQGVELLFLATPHDASRALEASWGVARNSSSTPMMPRARSCLRRCLTACGLST